MRIPDDEFIQELLPEFIDTWLNDLQSNFPVYLKEKNSEDMYRLAHTLKGSCFQFGLDDAAELGIKLMEHAKNNEWKEAEEMYETIIKEFEEAKVYIKEQGLG